MRWGAIGITPNPVILIHVKLLDLIIKNTKYYAVGMDVLEQKQTEYQYWATGQNPKVFLHESLFRLAKFV